MEKIVGKTKNCNYWALAPKWTLDEIILATEHSHDVPNNLVLFDSPADNKKFQEISRKM